MNLLFFVFFSSFVFTSNSSQPPKAIPKNTGTILQTPPPIDHQPQVRVVKHPSCRTRRNPSSSQTHRDGDE